MLKFLLRSEWDVPEIPGGWDSFITLSQLIKAAGYLKVHCTSFAVVIDALIRRIRRNYQMKHRTCTV
jgi:hypothetical protein